MQCVTRSLDLLSPKSHPLWCGDHVPSQKAPRPSVPALGSTGCRQWVTAAAAEQLLRFHTHAPSPVQAPGDDTNQCHQQEWGNGHPWCWHPSSLSTSIPRSVLLGSLALLPGQRLGSPSSQGNLPSSSSAPRKWIFTLFHSSEQKQQMRCIGLNVNTITAGNETELNWDAEKSRFTSQQGMSGLSEASPLEQPAPADCLFQGRAERTEHSAALKSKHSLFNQQLPALILPRNVFVHPLRREGCVGKVHVCLKTADSAAFECHSKRWLPRPCPGEHGSPQGAAPEPAPLPRWRDAPQARASLRSL